MNIALIAKKSDNGCMNASMSLIIFFLLAFTSLNLYALLSRKKRDKENEAKYNAIFAPIEKAILSNGKEWKDGYVLRLITENEQGIAIVRDDSRSRAAIAWNEGVMIFRYNEYISSEIKEDESGISFIVHFEDEDLAFRVSNAANRKNSYVTKTLRSNTESFVSFLEEINNKDDKEIESK